MDFLRGKTQLQIFTSSLVCECCLTK